MSPEFSARNVTQAVIEHLERRRYAIRGDVARARAEVSRCLEPMRRAYLAEDLPPTYLSTLESELLDGLPERWCASAERMTERELQEFGVWRGGDMVARLTYLFFFSMAAAIVAASQAPAMLKLLGCLLAAASWWLPAAQIGWHRRAYRQALDEMTDEFDRAQPLLERAVPTHELLSPVPSSPEDTSELH